jgi:hypothetical protein
MALSIGRLTAVGATVALTLAGCGAQTPSAAPATAGPTVRASPTAAPAASSKPTLAPTPAATPVGEAAGVAWSIRGAPPTGWYVEDGHFSRSENASVEVLPDRSVMASDRAMGPQPGVGSSAASVVAELAKRKGVTASKPESVSLGGLSGVRVDLSMTPDWTGTCPWWEGKAPVVPLIGTFDAQHYWLYNALVKGEAYRYLVFDLPDGRNLLVAVTTVDPERFSDVIGPAMDIVSKLDFAVGA